MISSFFADIFSNNSLNNGLLPVVVPENFLRDLFELIQKEPGSVLRIDLAQQVLYVPATGESVSFEINPYKKECLLKGLDDIDYLLSIKNKITAYEFRNTLRK